jgi:hypothetical protein
MITENFSFGMMVTQLVLGGIFVCGVLFIIGHEVVRMVRK